MQPHFKAMMAEIAEAATTIGEIADALNDGMNEIHKIADVRSAAAAQIAAAVGHPGKPSMTWWPRRSGRRWRVESHDLLGRAPDSMTPWRGD